MGMEIWRKGRLAENENRKDDGDTYEKCLWAVSWPENKRNKLDEKRRKINTREVGYESADKEVSGKEEEKDDDDDTYEECLWTVP